MQSTRKFSAWALLFFSGLLLSAQAADSDEYPPQQKSDSEIATDLFQRARAFAPQVTPICLEFGIDVPHVHVVQIDEAKETYTIDFYSWIRWIDNRLAFKPADVGTEAINIDPRVAWKEGRLWNPHVEFINVVETKLAKEILRIENDGTCLYTTRQTATFKFADESKAFRQFPFDQQKLRIIIGSFVWPSPQVEFHLDEDTQEEEYPRVRPAAEWEVTGRITSYDYDEVYTGENAPFRELAVVFTLKRAPGFYIWRICVPLLILVMIAISVLWMPADDSEARMILSVTTLVAVTTFSIVVNAALPRLPYLTCLDAWMLVSFILTALGAVENVYVASKVQHDQETEAEKADRFCRPTVLCLYALGSLWCAVHYAVISMPWFFIGAAVCTALYARSTPGRNAAAKVVGWYRRLRPRN
jgi:hypothetical protein